MNFGIFARLATTTAAMFGAGAGTAVVFEASPELGIGIGGVLAAIVVPVLIELSKPERSEK